MKRIIDEIKKLAETEKIDLKKFDPCIEIINGELEMRKKWEEEKKKLEKENKELTEKNIKIEEDNKKLNEECEQKKNELTDLKIKYCERFNSSPDNNDDPEGKKTNINIAGLFEPAQ